MILEGLIICIRCLIAPSSVHLDEAFMVGSVFVMVGVARFLLR